MITIAGWNVHAKRVPETGAIQLSISPEGSGIWASSYFQDIDSLRKVAGVEMAAVVETMLLVDELLQ